MSFAPEGIIGSTFAAGRAGIPQASNATAVSRKAITTKVNGSVGLTSKSRHLIKHIKADDASKPNANPDNVSFSPLRKPSFNDITR